MLDWIWRVRREPDRALASRAGRPSRGALVVVTVHDRVQVEQTRRLLRDKEAAGMIAALGEVPKPLKGG